MDAKDGNELVLGFWWYVTMVHDGVDDIIYIDGVEVNRKPVATKLNSTALPLGTVSYTHLDVYKRQIQLIRALLPCRILHNTILTMLL